VLKGGRERLRPNRAARVTRALRLTPHRADRERERRRTRRICSKHRAVLKGGRERLRPNRGFPGDLGKRMNPHK
jgi:hypothetical protein